MCLNLCRDHTIIIHLGFLIFDPSVFFFFFFFCGEKTIVDFIQLNHFVQWGRGKRGILLTKQWPPRSLLQHWLKLMQHDYITKVYYEKK